MQTGTFRKDPFLDRDSRIKRVRLPVDTRMVDDQDEVDEFEDEFEDYESLKDRIRRGPLLGVLLVTTLVAGAIWVVLNAIVDIGFAGRFFASEAGEVWIWVQAVREIAYSVFLVVAELLHVLMLPDFERADRIGEFWGYPESRVRLVRNRTEHEVGLESCFLH